MSDLMNEEETIYPEKPQIEKKADSIWKSFLSLILYTISFYFFFEKDFKSIFIFVSALFIHELGHLLAMKIFHYQDVKMFFIPFIGAFVKGEKETISQRQNSIILLAGPLPGIIIGFFLLIAGFLNSEKDLSYAGLIFLFLNLFNLIPFSPFDGGRLLETVFFKKKEFFQILFLGISSIGIVLLVILIESYVLLVIPILLFFQISNLFKFSKIRSNLELKEVKFNKSYQQLTDKEYWLIRDQIVLNFSYYKEIKIGNYENSPKEQQIIGMVKAVLTDKFILDLTSTGKAILIFIWCFFFLIPTSALVYLYSSSDPRQDRVIEQCITYNKKEAELNPELYKDYCYCISDFVLRYIDKTAKDEALEKEINIFLNPDFHPSCYSELQSKKINH